MTLTLATSGTGLSGSATYNNSGAQTFTVTSNATNANTASTLVARDGSGDFSAGTITATLTGNVTGNLTGTATTATNLANGANITTGTISDDRLPDLITSNVNIASGISSVATLDATNATIDNLTFTSGTAITSIDTDLSSISSNDDTLASAKAIKTYIDTEVTAQDLDFQADTGGALSIDLDSETLSVVGTSNEIETAGSGNQIQIGLPNEVAITTSLVVGSATTINAAGIIAGVITATTFSGGLETSNLSGTITNAQLAGSIANSKLANSSVSFGGVSVALGAADATPAFDLSDATNYPTSSLTGTITNAQLAGSIANDKLSNSSVSFGGVSVSLGAADATPAFDLQDATGYPTSSLTGTITNAQLAGSIADGKLASTFLKNVVEDTSPQLGGTLDTNGNRIQFGDSDTDADDRLQFGAGSDLEIYHDGSNSFIHDGGTGGLYIRAANTLGFRDVANSNANWANFNSGGSVDLYHNGNKRLETTTTGVKILNGTTATIAGPDEIIIDPATVGDNTGTVRIKGDLFVDGTTTQINSTTLELADFVVGVATTATTDLLTDGAGIGIGSDKTFLYEHNSGTNPSLKSSENLNVASGKGYQINQTEVLNATTLGSNVVSSSLTSVGTLSALTVSGRVDVGGLTVDSNLTPTAGASIEAFYNNGGFIQAYDRDAPGFTSLRIKSSNYELGSDGSATFGSSTNDQLILNPGSGSLDSDASKLTIQGRTNDGTAVAFEIKRQASANSGDASTHKLKIDYAGNFGIGSDFVPAGANGATLGAINKGAIIKGGDAAVGVRLESTAGSGGILEAFAEDGGVSFDTRGSGFIRVKSASTELFRITSDGKIGVNNTSPLSDLHVCTAGSSEQDGTFRIGGDGSGIGLVLDYDQSGSTLSRIMANDSYTNSSALLKISVDGDLNTNQLVLKGDGKIGIGTDNPSRNLSVYDASNAGVEIKSGTTGQSSVFFTDTADGNIGMIGYYHSDNSMFFRTNDAEAVRITSGGNVGIGTDNPSDKLSIFADPNSLVIGAKDTTRGNHIFQLLADDAGGNGELRLYRHSASGTHEKVVEITSSGNSYFNGGNIGIGTDSPEEILHVAAASETVNSRDGVLFQSTSALAADTGLPIVFTSNVGTDSNYGVASIAGRKENATSGEAQGYLQFSTGNRPGTITEKVRITSDGKVGIGSISPAQLLDIASTAPNIRFTDTADGHSEIDGNAAELKFNADKGNTKADSKITFFVDNDEKLLIDSAGRLGIGGNGVGSGLGVYLQRPSPNTTHFYEASDGTKTMITGVDSTNDYVKIGSLSNHRLGLVANNGEKVSIQSDGDVGINTTTPVNRLFVEEPTGTNATRTLVTFRKNHTTTTVSGNIAKDSFPHALMLENSDNSSDTGLASLGFTKFTSGAQSQAAIVGESTSAGTMDLTFHTESSNTIAEKVRITSAGDLQRPKSLSQEVSTSVSSVSATSCGSFAKATYRSAYVIAQITQGSSYQVGRYLVIHDGTTATTIEESAIATGDMLGTFSGVVSGSNVEFRVTMSSASSATVITKIESIVV